MGRAAFLLGGALLVALAWALWPSADAGPVELDPTTPAQQTDRGPAPHAEGAASEDAARNPRGATIPAAPPRTQERAEERPGFLVHATVSDQSGLPGLQTRLVYGVASQLEPEDWYHSTDLEFTKPKPVPADGALRFETDYQTAFGAHTWRVELGVAAIPGDESAGQTPLLRLGFSPSFTVLEGQAVELGTLTTQAPITLRVPLHDWHLLPGVDGKLAGQFEQRVEAWQTSILSTQEPPTVNFNAKDRPRLERSLRLSPWHVGRRFRVYAEVDQGGVTERSEAEWITLQPGESLLEILRPLPIGMLEIFFPASRALFPPTEGGLGLGNQVEVRLSRFDARSRTSFENRVLIDPTVRDEAYDPAWGMQREPGGGWQGDAYVARIGWLEAGAWQVAVDARHLNRSAAPMRIEVLPFDVTRIELEWLEASQEWTIVPTPAGATADEYVLATWARLGDGRVHRFAESWLGQQLERTLMVPPTADKICSVSLWNGHRDGKDRSSLRYYGGLTNTAKEQRLPIARAPTERLLDFTAGGLVTDGALGEISGLDGQLDGQVFTFTVWRERPFTLLGFPPGRYQIRVAPMQRGAQETRFQPWREIEIRSQPSPLPEAEAGAGN